ncbi:MAG: hypothetical protein E7201_10870 [Selenomonas ruminantium]|uniref:Uncharacterized protein n=1 Tax=Selenomonas ruminantium TaxID=971 RepID=A0A927WQZ2_SELRU|nr:hypothetical protein [Selenomonas ruminantium]
MISEWDTGDAPSLYDQLLAAGYRETDWTFYGIKDKFVEQGYSEAVARKMADDVTLRTGAIIFGTDGVRRQTIEMKGDNSQFRDFRSLFIDFHPDIHTSAALRENWNLTDIAGMTIEEAGEYFERLKISFIDGKLPDGTSLSRTKWEDLIAMLTANGYTPEQAMEMMISPMQNTINISNIYSVRDVENLPEADITRNTRGERNRLDPFFIRIEGEEFNGAYANNYYADAVYQITINNKVNNMDDNARPLIFYYSGPMDVNGKAGEGRKSLTVTFNLEADFKGILFAPNSLVRILGNGHNFRGIIVAQSIEGASGIKYDMSDNRSDYEEGFLSGIYSNLGLHETTYDGFGVVSLRYYPNPDLDVIYLTGRSKITN